MVGKVHLLVHPANAICLHKVWIVYNQKSSQRGRTDSCKCVIAWHVLFETFFKTVFAFVLLTAIFAPYPLLATFGRPVLCKKPFYLLVPCGTVSNTETTFFP